MPDHSPGPWLSEGRVIKAEIKGEEMTIATACLYIIPDEEGRGIKYQDKRQVRANIRLMTAAPDLLAACQDAIRTINTYTHEPIPVGVYNRLGVVLSNALGKATGQDA